MEPHLSVTEAATGDCHLRLLDSVNGARQALWNASRCLITGGCLGNSNYAAGQHDYMLDAVSSALSVMNGVLHCISMLLVTWWRHQMETFSALLALCAGISPVTG